MRDDSNTPQCPCGRPIEAGRLDALPHTAICAQCAIANPEPKVLGVPCYGHKTGGSIGVISPRATEAMRLVANQYRRTRWAG